MLGLFWYLAPNFYGQQLGIFADISIVPVPSEFLWGLIVLDLVKIKVTLLLLGYFFSVMLVLEFISLGTKCFVMCNSSLANLETRKYF